MGQILTMKSRKTRNRRKPVFDSGEEYFLKNGGILPEQQISLSQGQRIVAGQLKIFSYEDIEKATNYFDPDLIIRSSNLRIVYKATLEDRMVAVKAPPKIASCQHLRWVDRLRVATETAYALSYMHNALSKPVVHRHVNSHIILLDDSFHAKLTNFGFSVPITPGEAPQKLPIEGVLGYMDPEYITTQEVTEKCDVYSFGVLLLELLTRQQPFMMAAGGTDLVDVFISAGEKNCMMEMIDDEVLDQATMDEIRQVAQLALMCVAEKGSDRPTMIEVVVNLRKIQQGQENK